MAADLVPSLDEALRCGEELFGENGAFTAWIKEVTWVALRSSGAGAASDERVCLHVCVCVV